MSHTAPQIPAAAVGSIRNVGVDMTSELDKGESLSGTPVFLESGTSDLDISDKKVNTVILSILKVDIAIGKAVQCSVSGMKAGIDYVINGTITTDSTPPQKLPFKIRFTGEAA